jgi:hypothetical protein
MPVSIDVPDEDPFTGQLTSVDGGGRVDGLEPALQLVDCRRAVIDEHAGVPGEQRVRRRVHDERRLHGWGLIGLIVLLRGRTPQSRALAGDSRFVATAPVLLAEGWQPSRAPEQPSGERPEAPGYSKLFDWLKN